MYTLAYDNNQINSFDSEQNEMFNSILNNDYNCVGENNFKYFVNVDSETFNINFDNLQTMKNFIAQMVMDLGIMPEEIYNN